MAKTLKLGVIGAGAAARVHLPAFDRAAHAEVLGIADVRLDRAEALAQRYRIPVVTPDPEVLLRREEIDAVCLCTPPACHAPQTAAAIEAGKHVLCEMPLALDPAEGERLLEAARRKEVLLMPVLAHRLAPAYLRLRALLAEGSVGRPFHFRAYRACDAPRSLPPGPEDWRFDLSRSGGGALMDLGGAALDLVVSLMGTARTVGAQVDTLAGEAPVEDTAWCVLRGARTRGDVEVSWCRKEPLFCVEVLGTEGILSVGEHLPLRRCTPGGGWEGVGETLAPGAGALVAHFVECCLGRETPAVTAGDALRALELVRAAYRAAAAGREIALG